VRHIPKKLMNLSIFLMSIFAYSALNAQPSDSSNKSADEKSLPYANYLKHETFELTYLSTSYLRAPRIIQVNIFTIWLNSVALD